jgi:hypothetical protein
MSNCKALVHPEWIAMNDWYYKIMGQEFGPVPGAELKRLVGSGRGKVRGKVRHPYSVCRADTIRSPTRTSIK